MALATIDDVLGAFSAAWPTTGVFSGIKLHWFRKAPNDTTSRYAVVSVQESQQPIIESDGMSQQEFDVDLRVWTSENPAPTASYHAALAALYDGTKTIPSAGLAIVSSGVAVTLSQPQVSNLELSPDLRQGADVVVARRRWKITTASTQ